MSQPSVVPNIMEALEMKKIDVLHAVLRVINIVRMHFVGPIPVTYFRALYVSADCRG